MLKSFLLVGTLLLSQSGESSKLNCELTIPSKVVATDPVIATFTLQNRGVDTTRVLTWYTPLEGFWSALFRIENAKGDVLRYLGPTAKRLHPVEDDYLILNSNESVSTELNLSDVYLLETGVYSVTINKENTNIPCWQMMAGQIWTFEVYR